MEATVTPNILVAEDDPVMAKLLEFNLMRESYQVVICRHGKEVVERTREMSPDLILLDYIMPGADGLQVLGELQADEALRSIPVIMVTGQGRISVKENLLNAGARDVFTKPFSTIALLQAIREQLTGAQA